MESIEIIKERILLAEIYANNGYVFIDYSDDCKVFEILGFLKVVVTKLEQDLVKDLETNK